MLLCTVYFLAANLPTYKFFIPTQGEKNMSLFSRSDTYSPEPFDPKDDIPTEFDGIEAPTEHTPSDAVAEIAALKEQIAALRKQYGVDDIDTDTDTDTSVTENGDRLTFSEPTAATPHIERSAPVENVINEPVVETPVDEEPVIEEPVAAPTAPEMPVEDTVTDTSADKFAFKVRNLTKDYDGHIVLNNISFDIPKGKIVGLLGPNGCGKSTLMKILSGVIHDYTGSIKICGRPVGISSKAHLAYLPDRTYFPERFRTIDCINYFSDFFADFDKVKAIEFAEKFGLDLHQRVKTMSKGMQEKLQLLMVMSRAADVYLLDEPLGGVDPAARSVILDIIMSNYKENSTVVISTHLVNDLEHSFDHVLMLGKGQVLVNTGIDTLRATGKSVEEIFKEVIGDAWEVD